MNQEALNALIKDLKDTGTLIVDSTNVTTLPETKAKVQRIPITEMAKKTFGDAMYANMIMLGALVKATDIVSPGAVEKAIQKNVSAKTVETNTKAFRKGLELQTPI